MPVKSYKIDSKQLLKIFTVKQHYTVLNGSLQDIATLKSHAQRSILGSLAVLGFKHTTILFVTRNFNR